MSLPAETPAVTAEIFTALRGDSSPLRVVNRDLFLQVAKQIRNHPEQLNMDTWGLGDVRRAGEASVEEDLGEGCGTQFCIAGTAAVPHPETTVNFTGGYLDSARVDGILVGVDFAGRAALGLTRDEAERLFYPVNHRFGVLPTEYADVLEAIGHGADFDEAIAPILKR